jgi:hypothetical protein
MLECAMRTFSIVCTIALLLGWNGASAQSDAQSKPPDSPHSKTAEQYDQNLRKRMDSWYEDCRSSWDASTHMTKSEYENTCRRMARERVEFLSEQEKISADTK